MFLNLIGGKLEKIDDEEITYENYSIFSDRDSKRVQRISANDVLQENPINQYRKTHIIASKSMNFLHPIV